MKALILWTTIILSCSCTQLSPGSSKKDRTVPPQDSNAVKINQIESFDQNDQTPGSNGISGGGSSGDQNQQPQKEENSPSDQNENPETPPDEAENEILNLFSIKPKPASVIIEDDFIPFELETEEIRTDLTRVRRDNVNNLEFTRYISLTHLDYLEKDPEEFIRQKAQIINSISVILNSLSVNEFITKPVPVNSDFSLFRIDLRDYNWSQQQWEQLVSANAANPQKKAYPYNRPFDPAFVEIANIVQTRSPVLRGDWMIRESVKPFVYKNLLQLPDNLSNIESSVGVNRLDNINRTLDQPASTPRAVRTLLAPGHSGVSINNRILERHTALKGSYWMSYDFSISTDVNKDVFSSPIGPGNDVSDQSFDSVDEVESFNPDGGEVIFTLPNGLSGYLLADAAGDLIDEAPTNIVFNSADRDEAGVIENGRSCFSCHANGIIVAQDEMRPFMSAADDELFSDFIREGVLAMHIPQSQMESLIKNDNAIYLNAKKQARFFEGISDNITQSFDFYDDIMSKDLVASELNISLAQFQRILPRLSLDLRAALQSAESTGLERNDFENLFPQLLQEIFNLQQ